VERDYLEDLEVDEITILKWIFKKWDRETWTVLLWLRIGTGCGERTQKRADLICFAAEVRGHADGGLL